MSDADFLTSAEFEQIWDGIGPRLTDRVILDEWTFTMERPADADHLRKNAALCALIADTDYAPYWTDLWPASRMLAKVVLREPWPSGLEALEIGCGLGLPGIAALAKGLEVTFSDYDPVALRFAAENARRNNLGNFRLLRLDWRSSLIERRFPVVLASDLVYELKNVEPLVQLIERVLAPGGLCLVTDQDRVPAQALREQLSAKGLSYSSQLMRAGEPGGRRVKGTLYRITASGP